MGGPEPELGDADIGVAGNIHTAAGAGIIGAVVAEHQNEVNRLGIGRRRDDGNGHGTILVSAADANQAKNQNAQHAGPTPKIHPHPSRTIHELAMIRKSFHFNGWLEYAPAERSLALSL